MDAFAHLSVLISIVLGLGITNVLMGLARIVQMRGRVKIYWPPILWALVLLVIHVQTWWSMFGLRNIETWTFLAFSLTLMQPIFLFFLSALILPDFDRDDALDLRVNYYAQARWFFGILLTLLLTSLARTFALEGRLPAAPDLAFHAGFIAGVIPGLVLTSETFHKISALVAAGAVFAYVALLFTTLQ
ncbi:MAG: hypothetical protein KBA31_05330 [Alphaproteobacteria bacterium]|nr:hypothetical protein [Alphaproteobacteria bacterium]